MKNCKQILKTALLLGFLGLALTSCGNKVTHKYFKLERSPETSFLCQTYMQTVNQFGLQVHNIKAMGQEKAANRIRKQAMDPIKQLGKELFGENLKTLQEAQDLYNQCKVAINANAVII